MPRNSVDVVVFCLSLMGSNLRKRAITYFFSTLFGVFPTGTVMAGCVPVRYIHMLDYFKLVRKCKTRCPNTVLRQCMKSSSSNMVFAKNIFLVNISCRVRRSSQGAAQLSRVRRSSDSSASACCTAGPSSNPGSAPQGGPLLSEEQ